MKKRLIAAALLVAVSLLVTSLAGGLNKSLDVTTGVTVRLDGEPLDYTYPDGTKPEPFLSNGVTYLPVRAISEALGLEVDWEQDSMTVSLSSGKAQRPEPPAAPAPEVEVKQAASYDDVLKALSAKAYPTAIAGDYAVEETMEAEAEMPAPAPEPAMGAMEAPAEAPAEDAMAINTADPEYSGTNVQVEGVDEADIVKTDGKYIYMLRDRELTILEADGPDTTVLSSFSVGYYQEENERAGYAYYYSYAEQYPTDLYVCGDRLAVISSIYSSVDYQQEEKSQWFYDYENYTAIDLYDVSDPAAPELVVSLGQDGYYRDSRMLDGVMYLVTDYSVWDWDEEDPQTYVPCLYHGAAEMPRTPVEPGCVAILPDCSTSYAVTAAYDLAAGEIVDELCVLGNCDQVYMSLDNLYLTCTSYGENVLDQWTESVYTVTEYSSSNSTQLLRVALDGSMDVDASGAVPGYLESQFSMDEYQGCLRLVTTAYENGYRIYEDEKYGFTNYEWGSGGQVNALYVLDEALDVIGSVEDLAPDEQIYSARFSGETAYFCTFRNTDPLFAVDLSDPENPQVMDALKISGFSDYLHSWTDGLLFGLGMEADEDTGWTEEMKLVMFDVSDPYHVTAADCAVLDEYWSSALYNHHAILIDQAKNLICFPAGDSFYIYGYDQAQGFALRGCLELDVSSYDARSLYIGQYLYITSQEAVAVLDLDSLALSAIVELPELPDYYGGMIVY